MLSLESYVGRELPLEAPSRPAGGPLLFKFRSTSLKKIGNLGRQLETQKGIKLGGCRGGCLHKPKRRTNQQPFSFSLGIRDVLSQDLPPRPPHPWVCSTPGSVGAPVLHIISSRRAADALNRKPRTLNPKSLSLALPSNGGPRVLEVKVCQQISKLGNAKLSQGGACLPVRT